MYGRSRIDRDALFSDGTENFRHPSECLPGESFRVRFRAGKGNALSVKIVLNGLEEHEMVFLRSDGLFDYFECRLTAGSETLRYHFVIASFDGRDRCFYDRGGARETEPDGSTDLEMIPGYHVPEWARGRVFYQIFVDRFANGDPSNDVLAHEYSYVDGRHVNIPESPDVGRFFGGDLQGIIDKLDYLQGLGIRGIYLTPIFVSPSSHKYDVQDYDAVDPHFGRIVDDGGELLAPDDHDNTHAGRYIRRVTSQANLEASNELFAELVRQAHSRGMRVIIDGVFNHCGSFHKWFDREGIYASMPGQAPGAFRSEDSPYRDYFSFRDDGSYEGWWDFDTLPKLNYDERGTLWEDIFAIARKWISPPYDADGWRLDVAADLGHSGELNTEFWQRFRREVKSVDPDKLIIAEHYGPAADRLRGDQWDGIMNYDGFMEPVSWFFTGMDKHSDVKREDLRGNAGALFGTMMRALSEVQAGAADVMMNELSNHDHSRFMTRTNSRPGRVETLGLHAAEENVDRAVYMQGVVMQMTWPGMPTVYYGDEAGMCGFTDPDDRRPYPWGHEDQELIEFHRYIIRIHNTSPALMKGSVKVLISEPGVAAYGRFTLSEQIIVCINRGYERDVTVPVWQTGIDQGNVLERVMCTGPGGYNVGRIRAEAAGDFAVLELHMQERSASVWRVLAPGQA